MNLFGFLRRPATAPVARERLQILLSHERVEVGGRYNLIAELHEEILAVVARHIAIDRDQVQVRMERGAGQSLLEIEIELPHAAPARSRAA